MSVREELANVKRVAKNGKRLYHAGIGLAMASIALATHTGMQTLRSHELESSIATTLLRRNDDISHKAAYAMLQKNPSLVDTLPEDYVTMTALASTALHAPSPDIKDAPPMNQARNISLEEVVTGNGLAVQVQLTSREGKLEKFTVKHRMSDEAKYWADLNIIIDHTNRIVSRPNWKTHTLQKIYEGYCQVAFTQDRFYINDGHAMLKLKDEPSIIDADHKPTWTVEYQCGGDGCTVMAIDNTPFFAIYDASDNVRSFILFGEQEDPNKRRIAYELEQLPKFFPAETTRMKFIDGALYANSRKQLYISSTTQGVHRLVRNDYVQDYVVRDIDGDNINEVVVSRRNKYLANDIVSYGQQYRERFVYDFQNTIVFNHDAPNESFLFAKPDALKTRVHEVLDKERQAARMTAQVASTAKK